MITTLTQIHKLEERYPFNEEELEILVRCHGQMGERTNEDFLLTLALASPFAYYFLPGDEMRARVTWIENMILPMGFASQFRAAISADPFVTYANEGESKSLERFLEGVADTGRRGPKEALRVLYDIVVDFPTAEEIIDVCFRLVIACDALTAPTLDKKAYLQRVDDAEIAAIAPLVRSLASASKEVTITKRCFVEWAEKTLPRLSSPLSTFVHRLIFHQIPYPTTRLHYRHPQLADHSDIFSKQSDGVDPLLLSLSLTSLDLSGKVGDNNSKALLVFLEDMHVLTIVACLR
jgi:hypothetical protein